MIAAFRNVCAVFRPRCLPALNPDILLHVSTFLPLDDLACFSRTCRTMHDVLARDLLKHPAELWPQDLDSFSAYLLRLVRSPTGRLTFPWALNVDFRSADLHTCSGTGGRCAYVCRFRDVPLDDAGEQLVEIVKHARGLAELKLTGYTDAALLPEELQEILQHAPRVERLTLGSVDEEHLGRVLDDVAPRLRSFKLCCLAELRLSGLRNVSGVHAVPVMSRFGALQELDILRVHLCERGLQLPQLRKLRVRTMTLDVAGLGWASALAWTFPSLVHLEVNQLFATDVPLDVDVRFGLPHDIVFQSLLLRWRTDGDISQQAKAQGGLGRRHISLQYLRVPSLISLYCLAVECSQYPARVDIAWIGLLGTANIARAALATARPQRISLEFEDDIPKTLEALFAEVHQLPFLTHVVFMVQGPQYYRYGTVKLATTLGRALSTSSVSHVSLRWTGRTGSGPREVDLFDIGIRDTFGTVELVIPSNLDPVHTSALLVLHTLLSSVSSLRNVFIHIEDYDVLTWHDTGDAYSETKEPSWTTLDEAESERILAAEDMLCPGASIWSRESSVARRNDGFVPEYPVVLHA